MNINVGNVFTQLWAKHGKDHPDWFALQANRSHDQSKSPDQAQLCTSNAELIEAIVRENIVELKANPNLLGVSIAPNNGRAAQFLHLPELRGDRRPHRTLNARSLCD